MGVYGVYGGNGVIWRSMDHETTVPDPKPHPKNWQTKHKKKSDVKYFWQSKTTHTIHTISMVPEGAWVHSYDEYELLLPLVLWLRAVNRSGI